jgi:hypothetical protein
MKVKDVIDVLLSMELDIEVYIAVWDSEENPGDIQHFAPTEASFSESQDCVWLTVCRDREKLSGQG